MFCPPGYLPFSIVSIWFDEWRANLIKKSEALGYPDNLHEDDQWVKRILGRGDLALEQRLFFENCRDAAICGFDGRLMKIDASLFFEQSSDYWNRNFFPSELINQHETLLFVDESTFTISLERWRGTFSNLFERESYDEWSRLKVIADVVSRFEGWSLCVSEHDDEKMLEYIVERFRLPSAVLLQADGTIGVNGTEKKAGRPPLRKAKEEFAKMGYDRGDLSWEQLARLLEKKTGEKPHRRTMRDWARLVQTNTSPGEK